MIVALVLRPSSKDGTPDDFHVMHGGLRVGDIYKRQAAHRAETQWLWALNGVPDGPAGLRITGMTETRDQAQAQMSESWQQWLAWASLSPQAGE
jgi:hypothetical protein